MMRNYLMLSLLSFTPLAVWGQKERADIRQGNRAYYEGKYPEAEVGYKRAIEKNINSYEANFNLAGALYKQGRYDDAAAAYQKLAQDGSDVQRQASTYYNMGNTYVKQRKIDEAIEAYKNALRLTPDDKEAKFNLAYAKKLKQQQEQEQNKDQNNQNQNQNQDQNGGGGGGGGGQNNDSDQNQDRNQNPNRDNDSDRNKENNDRDKDRNNNRDDRNDRQPQQQPSASREESERLLRAIQASEDNTKKKVDAEKARAVGTRGGKQW